jgi:Uma2 family endonuclease
LRIERSAAGEIIIMPPTGFETGYRNNELSRQLGNWARADGRGVALDSNTEYVLPDDRRTVSIYRPQQND